uniref:Uncharacterized protein n=1 Tax=Cucumis melo TaxID=3656 RepID=A0A9I9E7X1_CUCME
MAIPARTKKNKKHTVKQEKSIVVGPWRYPLYYHCGSAFKRRYGISPFNPQFYRTPLILL